MEFQGKVFRVISFNWEILQIMQLEETTYWYSLLYELKTNLSVCLEPDFPHFEESYIEQLPRPHHPKERVWQTSEKKQIIRNINHMVFIHLQETSNLLLRYILTHFDEFTHW